MSLRTKVAQYRRCYLTDGQGTDASEGKTLQDVLKVASESISKPWLRAMGAVQSAHQLLTHLVPKNSCLCGEMVFYEPGRFIPLVDIQADGSTWQAAIEPRDASGNVRKFQEQSLVFAVRENHVAVIQSTSLQSDDLQAFLAWLVQSKAGLIPKAFIHLQNLPARSALDKLKDHDIRGIKFGERLFTTVREEVPQDDPKKRKRFVQRIETNPKILEILRGLGIDQPIIDNLSRNPDPGALEVDVEISYKSRSEKAAKALLYSLAATVGKQDGLDAEIRLKGNSTIKGNELSLRGQIQVQCPGGNVALDDAFSKLSAWLALELKKGVLP